MPDTRQNPIPVVEPYKFSNIFAITPEYDGKTISLSAPVVLITEALLTNDHVLFTIERISFVKEPLSLLIPRIRHNVTR